MVVTCIQLSWLPIILFAELLRIFRFMYRFLNHKFVNWKLKPHLLFIRPQRRRVSVSHITYADVIHRYRWLYFGWKTTFLCLCLLLLALFRLFFRSFIFLAIFFSSTSWNLWFWDYWRLRVFIFGNYAAFSWLQCRFFII